MPETIKEEYEIAKSERAQDAKDARREFVTFALSIIAATWVLFDKGIVQNCALTKLVFLFAVGAIGINLLGKIFRIQHWSKTIDDSSVKLDYRSTIWGKLSNISFYACLAFVAVSSVLFMINIMV